jgi:hypothetical protein
MCDVGMRIRFVVVIASMMVSLGTDAARATDAVARGSELVELATRPGVTQSFLVVRPPTGTATASVILFAGGDGSLNLTAEPNEHIADNFLVRSRNLFAEQRLLVALPDTPSDQASGYGGFRASDAHAIDIAAIIAYLRSVAPVPVWLVGTSRGTISAVNGALLQSGGPDGLVLTSAVTRSAKRHPQSVMDFPLRAIQLPTLIISHREDACSITSASDSKRLATLFAAAKKVEFMQFEGGSTTLGDPCAALSRHGYIGIEHEVVLAIAGWIKATALVK